MRLSKLKQVAISLGLLFGVASTAYAITAGTPISVPSAPGPNYVLLSTTTGAYTYVATSTLGFSSGSGTPGGASSTVQYNANGAFAGNSGFVYNGTNVGIGTSSPYATLSVGQTNTANGTVFAISSSTAAGNTPLLTIASNGVANFYTNGGGNVLGPGAFIVNANTAASSLSTVAHNASIHLIGPDNDFGAMYIDSFGSFGGSGGQNYRSVIELRAARGTLAAKTPGLVGDELGRIAGRSFDGTNWTGSLAAMSFVLAENLSTTNQGTYIALRTTSLGTVGGGSVTVPPEVVRIQPSGGISVGDTVFDAADPGHGVGVFENKLGVGTSSPYALLSVGTSTPLSASTALFAVGSSTNATLFNILANGNVGIGTTSPGSLFSLGGTGTGFNLYDNATSTFQKAIVSPCFSNSNSGPCISSGGSTSPGGASSTIQYNANGVFAGNTGLVYTGSYVGIGTTTPWAPLSISTSAQTSASTPLFSIASTTGQQLFGVYPGGYIQAGPTASRDSTYCTFGKYCLGYFASDNTLSGVNMEVGNYSNGQSAYGAFALENDLDDATGAHYASYSLNSSRYNDATFGSFLNVPNAAQLVNTDGPFLMQTLASTTALQYFAFSTGLNSEVARFTTTGLGIGTTTPNASLGIHGNISVDNLGGPFAYSYIGDRQFNGTPLAMTASGDVFVVSTTSSNAKRALAITAIASGGTGGNVATQGFNATAIASSTVLGNLTGTTIGGNLRNRLGTMNFLPGFNVNTASALTMFCNVAGNLSSTTNCIGSNYETPTVAAGDLITNNYAALVNGGAVSGTITNNYGFYVQDMVAGTNRYAFYNAGATDMNYFAGKVGISSTTPGSLLSIGATGTGINLGTGTTTFTGLGGINLVTGAGTAGCFAINGVCVGGGSGSGTVGSGTTGQFPYYAANGTTLTATSSLFLAATGFVGVGTTTPIGQFAIQSIVNSTTAFSIANASGSNVFSVDTTASNPFLGIGTTTPWATLSLAGNGTSPLFAVATTTNNGLPNFEIDVNGHMVTSGGKPTCDANCTFVAGNDNAFRVITGTAKTSMTVTFVKNWGNPTPICEANEGGAGTVTVNASSTPTTVVLTALSVLSGADIEVQCQGIQ